MQYYYQADKLRNSSNHCQHHNISWKKTQKLINSDHCLVSKPEQLKKN